MPDEMKEIKIEREKIKNAELRGQMVKVWLDDFKYLITIIILCLVTASNLGWIAYRVANKPHPRAMVMSAGHGHIHGSGGGSGTMAALSPDLSLLTDKANQVRDNIVNGGKIGAIALNIGLLALALYLRKKEKEKKAKKDADAKNPDSKVDA
jgi:hypothetical protein